MTPGLDVAGLVESEPLAAAGHIDTGRFQEKANMITQRLMVNDPSDHPEARWVDACLSGETDQAASSIILMHCGHHNNGIVPTLHERVELAGSTGRCSRMPRKTSSPFHTAMAPGVIPFRGGEFVIVDRG